LSLYQRTTRGVKWSAVSQIGRQLVQFLTTAILARLLSPEDYGLLGMALVITGFISIFKDLGTSSALVQRKDLTSVLTSSIFWTNVVLGLGIALLLFFGAPLGSLVYNEPRLVDLFRVLAFGFLFSSFGVVPQALLMRRMEFNKIAFTELTSNVVGAACGIGMALLGAGVWSLVSQTLMTSLLATMLLLFIAKWRPLGTFDWNEIRSIAGYSLNLSGYTTFNYFFRNADNFLIGIFLGAVPLGFYGMAYQLMLYANQSITGVVSRVLFPALSQIQDDNARLGRAYLKTCELIALVTFPLMLGLMVVAEPFVTVLFGAKWLPIVPLVIIFAPIGMLQSIGGTTGLIYTAKGRTDLMFRWGIIAGVAYVTAFALGVRWGTLGVAVGFASVSLTLLVPNYAIPFRLVGLRLVDLWITLRPLLGATILMCIAVLALLQLLTAVGIAAAWLKLILSVAFGAMAYLSLLFSFKRALLVTALETIGISASFIDRRLTRKHSATL
jgi:O-antigen/teichoic acid export membrane protein